MPNVITKKSEVIFVTFNSSAGSSFSSSTSQLCRNSVEEIFIGS